MKKDMSSRYVKYYTTDDDHSCSQENRRATNDNPA